jgi:alanine racemase
MDIYPITYIQVDLDAIAENVRIIKTLIGPHIKLMAVVKGNGYGHGSTEVAKVAIENGAEYLGVSTLDEGIELRNNGIKSPILIFTPIFPEQGEDIVNYNLIPSVHSLDLVSALNKIGEEKNKEIKVHVCVDTGFSRFGLFPDQVIHFLNIIKRRYKKIEVEGIYSHLSTANTEGHDFTRKQFEVFSDLLGNIKQQNIKIPLAHIANSAAAVKYPEMRLNMVRVGNVIYGQSPFLKNNDLNLRETWKFKSRIVSIKNIPKGSSIGYNREYIAKRDSVIGVIPVGHADGLFVDFYENHITVKTLIKNLIKDLLKFFNHPIIQKRVIVKGKSVPIIGRVSMQHCMVDLTDYSDIKLGDEVELPVRRVTASSRIRRIYFKNRQPICVEDSPVEKGNEALVQTSVPGGLVVGKD